MTKEFNLKKLASYVLIGFAVLAVLLYFIAGDSFHFRKTASPTIDAASVLGELTADKTVTQQVTIDTNRMVGYRLKFATYSRANDSKLTLRLVEPDGTVLSQNEISCAKLEDNSEYTVTLAEPILDKQGETVQLVITSDAAASDHAVTLYYGNSINLGRGSVVQSYTDAEKVQVNGGVLEGELYLSVLGEEALWFGTYYWAFAAGAFVLLAVWCAVLLRKEKTGKKSAALDCIHSLYRYQFLIKQLVSRDFKTKYRRSVLGVFWSFLNPLLTMLVQYVVFSTLFRSAIPNYPVYLLSGIVLFNFFNETTTVGLTAITSNAPLITKVYVPKFIYPLTRMLSSSINVAFSLIPLFIVTICTGVMPAASWLLLIYVLLCMMAFALGVTYILATMMVYFRDTQFLWTVVSMVWMYCTPIFYPENIIPAPLMPFYRLNPLYQLLKFARCALIDRVSPEPMAYLICLAVGVIPLVLGVWIFQRKQKDFALYL